MILEIEFDYRPADRADPQSHADLDLGPARLDGDPVHLPPAFDSAVSQLLNSLQASAH